MPINASYEYLNAEKIYWEKILKNAPKHINNR